jgi:hypothetical protein
MKKSKIVQLANFCLFVFLLYRFYFDQYHDRDRYCHLNRIKFLKEENGKIRVSVCDIRESFS